MTLRKRTLLTIGVIGLVVVVALHLLLSTTLRQSFTEMEKADARDGLARLLAAWPDYEEGAAGLEWLVHLAGFSSYQLHDLDDPQLSPDLAEIAAMLAREEPIILQSGPPHEIVGYARLPERADAPAMLLQVTLPRIHSQHGQEILLLLLAAVFVVLLVVGVNMLFLLERSILRPLARLSREVGQVRARGDLSARVSLVGRDELARLAGTINEMIAALATSQQALRQSEERARQEALRLEALRQVGLELTAQLDLETLLRSIVARAIHLLEADDGGLYLYRPTRDVLERVVSVGGTIPIGSILHRGEGLSGKVWETGRPLIVEDYQRWSGKTPVFGDEPSMAIVGVPVCWGERLLGILNVAALPPRRFTAADAELLTLLATQAAVALENARLYGDVQQRIAQLKSTQAQLVQSARLVAVGELAAGVAHQLNNSLTPILGYAELLADSLGADSPQHQDLERIITKARQSSEIVRNLLDFARQMKPQKEMVHLNDLARRTLTLVRVQLEKAGLTITEDYAADLEMLPVDAGQMGQVLLSLINNAAQAMAAGGVLRLQTYRQGREGAVAIADTGPGLSPDAQAHLFEPFFTTKPGHAGLGLSVSLGIVQEHGGCIEAASAPGEGCTFTVYLPLPE